MYEVYKTFLSSSGSDDATLAANRLPADDPAMIRGSIPSSSRVLTTPK